MPCAIIEPNRIGPDAFFRLGPAEPGKARCFAVRRGEAQTRLDLHYHRPEFVQAVRRMHQSRLTVVPLSSLTRKPGEIQNFGAYSLCNLIEWVQDGIPFVKVENYSEFGIDWSSVKHITPDVHKVLFKSKLKKGDTLLSMAGTIGISIVFDGEFQANSNQAIAKIRLSDPRIEPRFLSEFLNSDIGRLQSARISNGAVQANINLGEIGTIEVPIVSKSEQDKLVAAMDSARVSRQAKLAEADALLAGLDSFLLDTLGLAPPPRDERRVFAATVCQVREQSHLNADYFHPERILPLREMKAALPHGSAVRLAEAVDFIREQIKTPGPNYLSLAHVQSHTGELADANEEATGTCSKVSKGDVLFAQSSPLSEQGVLRRDERVLLSRIPRFTSERHQCAPSRLPSRDSSQQPHLDPDAAHDDRQYASTPNERGRCKPHYPDSQETRCSRVCSDRVAASA